MRLEWTAAVLLLGVGTAAAGAPRRSPSGSFCGETPTAGRSLSRGSPSRGALEGGVALVDSPVLRVMPRRHRQRCLQFGTARLVRALERAAAAVQREHRRSPPLGVGDLSRAVGGPIPPYSKSHQSGRDADLAPYILRGDGTPAAVEDLQSFDAALRGKRPDLRFDAGRNWTLVRALLTDPEVRVRWLFISRPLKAALLAEARRRGTEPALQRRAEEVLHQPSDAPPHDDHFHLRIDCTDEEHRLGCR